MNLNQSAGSDTDTDEATENTRLMSETVAMENRGYHVDNRDRHSVASGESSPPAVVVPSTETVSRVVINCCCRWSRGVVISVSCTTESLRLQFNS